MKVVKGNLITLAKQGEFDVIIHGCNCFNTMGAGIAKQIKNEFPEAYEVDQKTKKGDVAKMGSFTHASIILDDTTELAVVNAYTQFDFGGGQVNASYESIREVFKFISSYFTNKRIGYPKIGAGLAHGDWNIISKIIDEELEGLDHTLVVLS